MENAVNSAAQIFNALGTGTVSPYSRSRVLIKPQYESVREFVPVGRLIPFSGDSAAVSPARYIEERDQQASYSLIRNPLPEPQTFLAAAQICPPCEPFRIPATPEVLEGSRVPSRHG
jgi:hypothetical protein